MPFHGRSAKRWGRLQRLLSENGTARQRDAFSVALPLTPRLLFSLACPDMMIFNWCRSLLSKPTEWVSWSLFVCIEHWLPKSNQATQLGRLGQLQLAGLIAASSAWLHIYMLSRYPYARSCVSSSTAQRERVVGKKRVESTPTTQTPISVSVFLGQAGHRASRSLKPLFFCRCLWWQLLSNVKCYRRCPCRSQRIIARTFSFVGRRCHQIKSHRSSCSSRLGYFPAFVWPGGTDPIAENKTIASIDLSANIHSKEKVKSI